MAATPSGPPSDERGRRLVLASSPSPATSDLTPSGYVCNVRDVTEAETTEAAPPIMVRAEITADEWRQFRTLAVSTGVRVQQLVGEAIRRTLEENAS